MTTDSNHDVQAFAFFARLCRCPENRFQVCTAGSRWAYRAYRLRWQLGHKQQCGNQDGEEGAGSEAVPGEVMQRMICDAITRSQAIVQEGAREAMHAQELISKNCTSTPQATTYQH